jgi:HD-like signal output (HDOD) protein
MMLQSVVPTHQYLSKPCDPDLLQATVARACALRDVMTNKALQSMISGLKTLPSLPNLYFEILDTMESLNGSLEKVGTIIEQDMAMTAKILQLVNSAFFGVRSQVSNPAQAAGLLGLETIKALILSVHVFEQCNLDCLRQFNLESLWQHSHETATWAKKISMDIHGEKRLADDAYMAGLLHDIGRLVLVTNLPDTYSEIYTLIQDQNLPAWEAEQHILEVTHAEVGAYLLELWGLAEPVVEAVAFHHCPLSSPALAFSPLAAVHIANALSHESRDAEAAVAIPVEYDYLDALGLSDRIEGWHAAYQANRTAEKPR